jgi:hypothetical protein
MHNRDLRISAVLFRLSTLGVYEHAIIMVALRMAFPYLAIDRDWSRSIELLCESLDLTQPEREEMFATAGRISGHLKARA